MKKICVLIVSLFLIGLLIGNVLAVEENSEDKGLLNSIKSFFSFGWLYGGLTKTGYDLKTGNGCRDHPDCEQKTTYRCITAGGFDAVERIEQTGYCNQGTCEVKRTSGKCEPYETCIIEETPFGSIGSCVDEELELIDPEKYKINPIERVDIIDEETYIKYLCRTQPNGAWMEIHEIRLIDNDGVEKIIDCEKTRDVFESDVLNEYKNLPEDFRNYISPEEFEDFRRAEESPYKIEMRDLEINCDEVERRCEIYETIGQLTPIDPEIYSRMPYEPEKLEIEMKCPDILKKDQLLTACYIEQIEMSEFKDLENGQLEFPINKRFKDPEDLQEFANDFLRKYKPEDPGISIEEAQEIFDLLPDKNKGSNAFSAILDALWPFN